MTAMAAAAVGALWLPSLLSLSLPGPAASIRTTAEFVKRCVDEHNRLRSSVSPGAANMLLMSWDAGLAKTAKAWSKTCKFKNNPHLKIKGKGHPFFESIGENIYVTSGKFSVEEALKEWVAEGIRFNYDKNTCLKKQNCNRYTQLVWGDSYKLGCGAYHCPKGIEDFKMTKGTIFVCNYAPCGNRRGQLPYVKGAPCTYCGPDFCRDKLCKYPKWKPDFGSASISWSKCLLLRTSITIMYILW
ncbi:GLIPR1-like protein 1 isoform X2 [Narcine bancroftii]|uniref:GLIPR1-like protein 1 isoform X2 n=1 Tax=Narcine bancroftii TaxID=1343680 RepID=UPI0038321227